MKVLRSTTTTNRRIGGLRMAGVGTQDSGNSTVMLN